MPKRVDLAGRRIGRVVILERDPAKPNCTFWKALCDCGNRFSCYSVSLKRGERFECKKCMLERKRGADLTGRKYGRWTVIGMGVDKTNYTVCHCLCDCGKTGDVAPYVLMHPRKSKSCGCWGRKIKSKYANTTLYPPAHGLATSSFYSIRLNLIHKCYKEKHPSYHKFGAKGITVCDLWRNSAKDMYDWALSRGWREKDVFCLKEGAKEFNPDTVYLIPHNDVCSMIGQSQGEQITYKGETHSIQMWAKIMKVDRGQLRRKIKQLPSVDEAFGSYFRKCKFQRNPDLVKEMIAAYESGKTQQAVADLFDVHPMTIRYHLVKHKVKLREGIPLKKPEVTNEQIVELLSKGVSKSEMSRRLGMSDVSIAHRIEKMHGIKRDRTRG